MSLFIYRKVNLKTIFYPSKYMFLLICWLFTSFSCLYMLMQLPKWILVSINLSLLDLINSPNIIYISLTKIILLKKVSKYQQKLNIRCRCVCVCVYSLKDDIEWVYKQNHFNNNSIVNSWKHGKSHMYIIFSLPITLTNVVYIVIKTHNVTH